MPRRRKKAVSKKECQWKHTKAKILERFGLTVNAQDRRRLVEIIQRGSCEFIKKQSNRMSIYKVYYRDICMYLAYDRQRETLSTALTEDMVNNLNEYKSRETGREVQIETFESRYSSAGRATAL